VLALVLMWIKGITSVDHQVLRDNWSGRGDVIGVIENLHTKISSNTLISENVWQKLRKTFAKTGRKRFSLRRKRA